jgi:REP element-mobilizing transposase RayT
LEFLGAVYHLTSPRQCPPKIFFSDNDRELFPKTLSQVVSRYGWICHAYCLMANHYHLLVETPKANLSIGMRQLNGMYTQSFNRAHKRVGHLFQGSVHGNLGGKGIVSLGPLIFDAEPRGQKQSQLGGPTKVFFGTRFSNPPF